MADVLPTMWSHTASHQSSVG